MELIKAKQILIVNAQQADKKMPAEVLSALIIGISSIARIATMRSFNINQALLPLKGETSRGGQSYNEDTLKRLRESPLGSDSHPYIYPEKPEP